MGRDRLAELGVQFGKSKPPPPCRRRSPKRKAPTSDSSRHSSPHRGRGNRRRSCLRSLSRSRHDERKRSRHSSPHRGRGCSISPYRIRDDKEECKSSKKKESTSTIKAQSESKSTSSTTGASQSRSKTTESDFFDITIQEIALLSFKNDMDKMEIGYDKFKIEKREKKIKQLYGAMYNKDIKLIEARKRTEEQMKEKTIIGKELRTTQDEHAKCLGESVKLTTDLDRARADLKTSQGARDNLGTEKVNIWKENELLAAEAKRLRVDNTELTNETVDLRLQLEEKTSLIESYNDLIDSMYYNIWKYKGLSWSDSYASILLMIRRRAVQEAREGAKSRGEEFDEGMYLLTTFSDEERRLQAQAIIEEENDSSSGSDEVSGYGESTGSTGEAEEQEHKSIKVSAASPIENEIPQN